MTKSLFDVLREAMMNNPDGSRKEHQDAFVATVTADLSYFEMLAIDYFERMSASRMVVHDGLGVTFGRTEASQEANMARPDTGALPAMRVRRTKEETTARTAAAFAAMKSKLRDVILLDLVLPNGKALRQATGAECAKAGGFFADVARAIKPTQVVDRHLSERDLQNIRARFFQANKAA